MVCWRAELDIFRNSAGFFPQGFEFLHIVLLLILEHLTVFLLIDCFFPNDLTLNRHLNIFSFHVVSKNLVSLYQVWKYIVLDKPFPSWMRIIEFSFGFLFDEPDQQIPKMLFFQLFTIFTILVKKISMILSVFGI